MSEKKHKQFGLDEELCEKLSQYDNPSEIITEALEYYLSPKDFWKTRRDIELLKINHFKEEIKAAEKRLAMYDKNLENL